MRQTDFTASVISGCTTPQMLANFTSCLYRPGSIWFMVFLYVVLYIWSPAVQAKSPVGGIKSS